MVLKNGIIVSIEGDNMDIKAVRGLLSEVNLSALEDPAAQGQALNLRRSVGRSVRYAIKNIASSA